MTVGYLVDKSALTRWDEPSVAAVLDPALAAGLLWSCPPVELEVQVLAGADTRVAHAGSSPAGRSPEALPLLTGEHMFDYTSSMGLALLERPGEDYQVLADGPEARLGPAMGLLNAATAEVVAAIAEALAGGGWRGDGITTAEHWVALRCGVTTSRARRLVAAARGLAELPVAAAAFGQGVLSEDQVGVICAHVDAAHDGEVTELARRCTIGQLRRILPSVVAPTPATDSTPDARPLAGEDGDAGSGLGNTPGRRETAFGNQEDGRWWARILLSPDEGALVQKALEASRSALFRARRPEADADLTEPAVGWSDALVHMAETALSDVEGTGRLPADRFQVIFHVDADDPERARLQLGPLLPASLRDYLACDATGRMVLERKGTPVHVFARQRTVDDRLRALVEQRDDGCRVPGCGQRRWLHVHHLLHHEDGGLTIPANLCCLCPAHHRLHHAGRLGIAGDPTTPDGLRFTDHLGRPIRGPSPARQVPHPPKPPPPWACPRPGGSHPSASASTPCASPGADWAEPKAGPPTPLPRSDASVRRCSAWVCGCTWSTVPTGGAGPWSA